MEFDCIMRKEDAMKIFILIIILAIPFTAHSHAHLPMAHPGTILASHGPTCANAIHEYFHHPAMSVMGVVKNGEVTEITIHGFTIRHPGNLPHVITHAAQLYDFDDIPTWKIMYADAHRWSGNGHIMEVRAIDFERDFRLHYQGVCDEGP